jgi:hypothetical protein
VSTAPQRAMARALALASAYLAVSLLERMAAAAEAEAAAARLAAHTEDGCVIHGEDGCDCASFVIPIVRGGGEQR